MPFFYTRHIAQRNALDVSITFLFVQRHPPAIHEGPNDCLGNDTGKTLDIRRTTASRKRNESKWVQIDRRLWLYVKNRRYLIQVGILMCLH